MSDLRLRYDTPPTEIIARREGEVLIGGLGILGVGQMWYKETPDHKNKPGYDTAPFLNSNNESIKQGD